jgi:hypothetical protein
MSDDAMIRIDIDDFVGGGVVEIHVGKPAMTFRGRIVGCEFTRGVVETNEDRGVMTFAPGDDYEMTLRFEGRRG